MSGAIPPLPPIRHHGVVLSYTTGTTLPYLLPLPVEKKLSEYKKRLNLHDKIYQNKYAVYLSAGAECELRQHNFPQTRTGERVFLQE
jgi:hypothetical protein